MMPGMCMGLHCEGVKKTGSSVLNSDFSRRALSTKILIPRQHI